MTSTAALEIKVVLVDGSSYSFVQTDPDAARKSIGRVVPTRVFTSPSLTIASAMRTTTFPTRSIMRLELTSDLLPEWDAAQGLRELNLVDEKEVETRIAALGDTPRSERRPDSDGGFEAAGVFLDSAGVRHHLVARGRAMPEQVRAHVLTRRLEEPCILARRGDRVVVLFHTAHLTCVVSYPGAPEAPPNAIDAEPTS